MSVCSLLGSGLLLNIVMLKRIYTHFDWNVRLSSLRLRAFCDPVRIYHLAAIGSLALLVSSSDHHSLAEVGVAVAVSLFVRICCCLVELYLGPGNLLFYMGCMELNTFYYVMCFMFS